VIKLKLTSKTVGIVVVGVVVLACSVSVYLDQRRMSNQSVMLLKAIQTDRFNQDNPNKQAIIGAGRFVHNAGSPDDMKKASEHAAKMIQASNPDR
jgi:hypothetical protein